MPQLAHLSRISLHHPKGTSLPSSSSSQMWNINLGGFISSPPPLHFPPFHSYSSPVDLWLLSDSFQECRDPFERHTKANRWGGKRNQKFIPGNYLPQKVSTFNGTAITAAAAPLLCRRSSAICSRAEHALRLENPGWYVQQALRITFLES